MMWLMKKDNPIEPLSRVFRLQGLFYPVPLEAEQGLVVANLGSQDHAGF